MLSWNESLPYVLEAIRNYTNCSFFSKVALKSDFIIENNIITLNGPLEKINLYVGALIEFPNSNNNSEILMVKTLNTVENSIETYNKLNNEIFSGWLLKLKFDGINNNKILEMIYYDEALNNAANEGKFLDEVFIADNSKNILGYPRNTMSAFDSYKKLSGGKFEEYLKYGFLNIKKHKKFSKPNNYKIVQNDP